MEKFSVELTEVRKFYFQVEAKSEDEASKVASKLWGETPENEEHLLDYERDFSVTDVEKT
jgi:hypothetical protein